MEIVSDELKRELERRFEGRCQSVRRFLKKSEREIESDIVIWLGDNLEWKIEFDADKIEDGRYEFELEFYHTAETGCGPGCLAFASGIVLLPWLERTGAAIWLGLIIMAYLYKKFVRDRGRDLDEEKKLGDEILGAVKPFLKKRLNEIGV